MRSFLPTHDLSRSLSFTLIHLFPSPVVVIVLIVSLSLSLSPLGSLTFRSTPPRILLFNGFIKPLFLFRSSFGNCSSWAFCSPIS
ncbi:hypothetical protein Nepgr_023591 [Nepenthes gracilis]|uniref:Uncharacterized protein n=1 Tax=Nepenthes gracilis TaxID=150966 RepID=A0AAD3XZ73_NEPGR|nr:hypothetical protein Nepgr_023591 [Nepenthes gracilis]